MEECAISGIDGAIENSLLGKNVVLRKIEGKPKTFHFIHGDHSVTELP
jgi:hypothetical protein